MHEVGVWRRYLRLKTVARVAKIGEANEVFEVVVATARYGVDAFFEVELLQQKQQKVIGHLRVVHKANGLSFFALLQAFFNFFEERQREVVVEVEFGIARKFEGICFNLLGLVYRKNLV